MAMEISNLGVTDSITTSEKDKKAAAKKAAEEKGKTIYQQALEQAESGTTKKVGKEVKADLKDMYKKGTISKEVYKAAKKEGSRKDYKEKAKSNLDSAEDIYLLYDSNEETRRKYRNDVRKQIKADYEAGKYTKEQYETLMQATSKGSALKRFGHWLGLNKDKKANTDFETGANGNKIAHTKEAFKKGEKQFSKDTQKLVAESGYSIDELYDLAAKNHGTDNFFNYSYTPIQAGEMDGFLGDLNHGQDKVKFTKEQAIKLAKEMGIPVGPAVETGHAVAGAAEGAILGSTTFLAKIKQDVHAPLEGFVNQKVIHPGWISLGVGTAVGLGNAIYKDIHRVEPRVMEDKLPDNVKTYEDLEKYARGGAMTKEGADIVLKIANYFKNEDGTLKLEEFNEALKEASSQSSVLNYEEARSLYKELLTGKKVVETEPVDETPSDDGNEEIHDCEIAALDTRTIKTPIDDTKCYTVKYGDNWYAVAEAKYGAKGDDLKAIVRILKDAYYEANKAELNKKGIKSSKGSFFPKVGQELCTPITITVNNKTYTYNEDTAVKAGSVVEGSKSFNSGSNPFLKIEESKRYGAKNGCSGNEYWADTQEEANKLAKEDKKTAV